MAIKRANYDPAARFGATPLTPSITADKTLVAEESGTVFFLNLAAGFAITLPDPTPGIEYEFIVKTAPTSNITITSYGSTGNIKGQQYTAADAGGDTGTADNTITFVANQAAAGDRVKLITDGSYWYAYAFTTAAANLTFTSV